jgi:hypothetical protein
LQQVAAYRQFARDYSRLAALLKSPDDKRAMELMATGWDKVADRREAILLGKSSPNQRPTCSSKRHAIIAAPRKLLDEILVKA